MRNELLSFAQEVDKAAQKVADEPKSNAALVLLVSAEENYRNASRLQHSLGKLL